MEVKFFTAGALQRNSLTLKKKTKKPTRYHNWDDTDKVKDQTSGSSWSFSVVWLGGLKQASISSSSKRVVRCGSWRSSNMGMCSFCGGGRQEAGSWMPSPFLSLRGAPRDTNTIWVEKRQTWTHSSTLWLI